jgi:hypothetical protein
MLLLIRYDNYMYKHTLDKITDANLEHEKADDIDGGDI